jgi:hypothetical protein
MKRVFIETQIFTKRWNDLNLTDDDLKQLQGYILNNPNSGDIIQGTGGLTKLRFALPDTGKSGGARVLYIDFITHEKVFLINCYSKSMTDSLSGKEKAMYKALIKQIKGELK